MLFRSYGLSEDLEKMASKIATFGEAEKQASLYRADESLWLQEEVLRGGLGYGQDLTKVANYAEGLISRFNNGESLSHETHLYSGGLPFGTSQLTDALEKRAYFTKDESYTEVLGVVNDLGIESLNSGCQEKRASIAKAVVGLDKKHHYKGNFYTEAFVKEASYTVKLAHKSVPFESLCKLGSAHIGDILGKDVASALNGDYSNDKAVIESLPLDERSALERFV